MTVSTNPSVANGYTDLSGAQVVAGATGVAGVTAAGRVVGAAIPFGGPVIAALGDSITYNNNQGTTSARAIGAITWARALSGQAFRTSPSLNFGVSGETSVQVLARTDSVIATCLAAGVTAIIEMSGVNDAGTRTAAEIYSTRLEIWRKITAAGMVVIAGTVTAYAPNTTTAARIGELNYLMRRNAQNDCAGCFVWDAYPGLADLSVTTGAPIGGRTTDNLHPNQIGAYWMGKTLLSTLQRVFVGMEFGPHRAEWAGDWWQSDATNHPAGNRWVNPQLAGIGGTKSGAYATGDVADSCTVFRSSGSTLTAVCSKVTRVLPTGQTINGQRLVVSSPGGGGSPEIMNFQQAITVPAGAQVLFGAYISVSAITGAVMDVGARAQNNGGAFSVISDDLHNATNLGAPPESFTAWTETYPGAMASGVTSVNGIIRFQLVCTSAASITVDIYQPYLRVVG